jgi:hypothetical protein
LFPTRRRTKRTERAASTAGATAFENDNLRRFSTCGGFFVGKFTKYSGLWGKAALQ